MSVIPRITVVVARATSIAFNHGTFYLSAVGGLDSVDERSTGSSMRAFHQFVFKSTSLLCPFDDN